MIWDAYPTGPKERSGGWNNVIGNFPGWSVQTKWFSWRTLKEEIAGVLASGSYLILGTILDKTTGKLVDSTFRGVEGYAEHWVVVKGVSDRGIYIYNPYTNSTQYYSWDEFKYRVDGKNLVPDEAYGAAFVIKYHNPDKPVVDDKTPD